MKGGDMLSMYQLLREMEDSVSRLISCFDENQLADMPYLLGRLSGYSELLQDIVRSKLCEGKEVTYEGVPEVSQDDPGG